MIRIIDYNIISSIGYDYYRSPFVFFHNQVSLAHISMICTYNNLRGRNIKYFFSVSVNRCPFYTIINYNVTDDLLYRNIWRPKYYI